MNKALLSVFTVAATFLSSTPVYANTSHVRLVKTIDDLGVAIRVNEYKDCAPEVNDGQQYYGWYSGARGELIVCQEQAIRTKGWGKVYNFTAEDLDTLRHEAHHMVQDCMDKRMDGLLDVVYTEPVDLGLRVLGRDGVMNVVRAYNDESNDRQILEIEAFAVAAMNDPEEQIRDIKTYCM